MIKEIKNVRDFAIKKHHGQKYGEHDYVYHLDEVFTLLSDMKYDIKYLIAAYLHDVLEDVKEVSKEELIKSYGKDVYDLIFAVSGFGNNRKEKQRNIVDKLVLFHPAIDLKICDRIINISNCIKNHDIAKAKMYLKEKDIYDGVFCLANPLLYEKINNLYTQAENINKIKTKPF